MKLFASSQLYFVSFPRFASWFRCQYNTTTMQLEICKALVCETSRSTIHHYARLNDTVFSRLLNSGISTGASD